MDPGAPKYTTTDASELFFKNVRSPYYDYELQEPSMLKIYRLKKRATTEDYPVLNLAQIQDWRRDKAMVLFEPNHYFDLSEPFGIACINDSLGVYDSLDFAMVNLDLQYKAATIIYNHIIIGSDFYLNKNGAQQQILAKRKEREAFRVTMFDFYRLVELL